MSSNVERDDGLTEKYIREHLENSHKEERSLSSARDRQKAVSWYTKPFTRQNRHLISQRVPRSDETMEELSKSHEHKSCPPGSQGKTTTAPFRQDQKKRYALLEAV